MSIETKPIITSAITSLFTAGITAFCLWAWSGLSKLPGDFRIPRGTVIAVNATRCLEEDGWMPYEKGVGRVIMGVGNVPYSDIQLALEETKGNLNITITVPNLPSHQHETNLLVGVPGTTGLFGNGSTISEHKAREGVRDQAGTLSLTQPVGDGKPIT